MNRAPAQVTAGRGGVASAAVACVVACALVLGSPVAGASAVPRAGSAASVVAASDTRSAPSPAPGVRPVAPTFVPAGELPVAVPIAGGAWLAVAAILVVHIVWRRRRDAAEAGAD